MVEHDKLNMADYPVGTHRCFEENFRKAQEDISKWPKWKANYKITPYSKGQYVELENDQV